MSIAAQKVILLRYSDWHCRLNDYLNSYDATDFKYGERDCCTFVAGAVEVMLGVDYMGEFRGHYNDDDSADEALRTIGQGSLYRTMTKKFGKALHGAQGQKGDIAFYEGAIGIVLGSHAMFTGVNGFVLVSIMHVQRIWRLPL